MKLIKLTNEHYIICDDSEIKEGDWLYSFDNGLIVQANKGSADTINSKSLNGKGYGKITHSTQPLYKNDFWAIQELKLSEVKELIGDVDNIVDELSEKPHYTHSSQQEWFKIGAYSGYNQAIEDNKEKKYTENQAKQIWKAGQEYWKTSGASITFEELTERMIKQPKTEWYVEFDSQGKLKLL